jgi:hypothetical protein
MQLQALQILFYCRHQGSRFRARHANRADSLTVIDFRVSMRYDPSPEGFFI